MNYGDNSFLNAEVLLLLPVSDRLRSQPYSTDPPGPRKLRLVLSPMTEARVRDSKTCSTLLQNGGLPGRELFVAMGTLSHELHRPGLLSGQQGYLVLINVAN